MAFVGTEWLILAGIILVIFLVRPRAITDLARSAGQVVAEFKKGKRGSEKAGGDGGLLVETAEKLGIQTEGKTPSQIREEILAKAGRDEH